MEIISLDKDRVKIYEDHVTKKTQDQELCSLIAAKKIADNLSKINILNTDYKIIVPSVYNYNRGIITMERCFGDNLELILREINTYHKGVSFANDLLNFFITNNFYWKDFAPRNILISDDNISICDFERGVSNQIKNLQSYFLDSVYEEYGAFILPDDRIYHEKEIFKSDNNKLINFNDISSKRVKTILNILGYHDYAPYKEYVLVVKMIVENETPYIKNDKIIFPLLELEKYINEKGYEEYAKKIIGGYYEKQKRI